MCNNKPKFTVLLKVSDGVMHVDQIVGLSNARLNDIERNLYENMFSKALQLREEELKSVN
jgi:predicted GNAT superfamily acetyltransferase